MFTGLVSEMGTVAEVTRRDGGARVRIAAPLASSLEGGDSVLVNGVCLTAASVDHDRFEADISPETARRTSLDALEAGERVNLELGLRPHDRLGRSPGEGPLGGGPR